MPGGTIETQVVVIGAGPGGYAAAFHAAELGLRTTLINAEPKPGGVCLHRGCIPSKALLHIAKLTNEAREASAWGLQFQEPTIDLAQLRDWKNGIIEKLAGGVSQLCAARGVEYLPARARFANSNTLTLEWPDGASSGVGEQPTEVVFEHAIIATGSTPAVPGILRIDDPRVMDSTGALELEDVPNRLLVVGGGYIGLEMGTVYAGLGSRVTVVELTDGLLPGCDRDLVKPLQKRLGHTLDQILLNTKVEGLSAGADGITATLSGKDAPESMLFDRVLISIGRTPNSRDLGLENTSVVVTDRGFVEVDACQRTAESNIYAIGDIAGEPMLAHKASKEAKVAAEVIAGEPAEFDSVAIPAVVFTDPEVAWCGLTETEAKAEGREVEVAKFPWAASGRALTLDRTEGLTKLIVEPGSERILGVGMVGPGAGDMIAEGALAIEMAAVARDVADTIHPHPTLSETVMEAAEVFLGHSTHLFRPKK